jgi:polyisoprenoid-binding protein YceI
MMLIVSLLATAVAVATATNPASCASWHSVADNSNLLFIPTFEGTPAPGKFPQFSVCMGFEPEQPQAGRLEVWIDITSADMDSADLNQEISRGEWFDSLQFPEAHFLSEHIESSSNSAFVAHGRLTLKGVEREVDVPFSWKNEGTARRMNGELTLKRSHFGIGTGEWAEAESIGFDVTVRFSVFLETPP